MQLMRKSPNGTNLYLSAFIIFLAISNLMVSTASAYVSNNVYAVVKYICVTIVLFKMIFLTKYTLPEVSVIIPLIVVVVISAFESQVNTLLFGTIFIIGAKDIPFEKMAKAFFYTSLILTLGMLALSVIGVISNDVYYRESIPRYSFGSNYPTDFGAHVFYLLTALFYLRRKKYGYIELLVSIGSALFIWRFCDARLDAGLILMLGVGLLITSKHKFDFKKFFDSCFMFLPLSYVISGFSIIILTIKYDAISVFYNKLDSWLSQRLSIGHSGYEAYGIKLFGQYIEQHGWGGMTSASSGYVYFFLDSSFVELLLAYGSIVVGVFILAFTYISFKRLKERRIVLVVILSIIAASGIVDQHIIDLAFNPFLYVFWNSSFSEGNDDFADEMEVER